jgi:uncharacterized damage-inducible protein DinB
MPQRILAEAELAWGKLLGATVGLTDEDMALKPPEGGWSVLEVLEHVLKVERLYLATIREARERGRCEEVGARRHPPDTPADE